MKYKVTIVQTINHKLFKTLLNQTHAVQFIVEPFIQISTKFPFIAKRGTLKDQEFLNTLNFLCSSPRCVFKKQKIINCKSLLLPNQNNRIQPIEKYCYKEYLKAQLIIEVAMFPKLKEKLYTTGLLWCYIEKGPFYGVLDPILFNKKGVPQVWANIRQQKIFYLS